MQPNQPHDPQRYDFFLNPAPTPKKNLLSTLPGSSDPFIKRVMIIVGGGTILVLFSIILATLVFGGKTNTAGLLTIAQQQNELIRITTLAESHTTTQTAKNLDISTQLSLITNQQQLLTYSQKHGHKISTKDLALTKNTATDQQFTNAQAASNFDKVFAQTLQTQLTSYANALKLAFKGTSNLSERQLFNIDYGAATLLLAQAASVVNTL